MPTMPKYFYISKFRSTIITKPGIYNVFGYTNITVSAPDAIDVTPLTVTKTGTYSASENSAFNPVTVSISGYTVEDIAVQNVSGAISGSPEYVASFAFVANSNITNVNFPNCTTIYSTAFQSCISLTEVSFPACMGINDYAFQYCTSLTTVSFPQCTTIGDGAFRSCYALTTVSFPQCMTIGYTAFQYCSSLTEASFPLCTTIGNGAFQYCSSLTSVSFPSCTSIEYFAFANCSSLTEVSFPPCTTIEEYAFEYCSSLTTVSFPQCTTIGDGAFQNCYNLISLYLLNSSIVTLTTDASTIFASTPLYNYSTVAGQWGNIYVPSSLYSEYIADTNWEIISSRIVSM